MRIPARHGTRYAENRAYFLEKLGGKCLVCGTTANLEFDHIDPDLKAADVATLMALAPRELIEEEVAKCQLLCAKHHRIKSFGGIKRGSMSHGKDETIHFADQYNGAEIIISVRLYGLTRPTREEAARAGMTVSAYIRRAIKNYLQSIETT